MQDNAGRDRCTQCSYVLSCKLHHVDLQDKVISIFADCSELLSARKLKDHMEVEGPCACALGPNIDIFYTLHLAMEGLIHRKWLGFEQLLHNATPCTARPQD